MPLFIGLFIIIPVILIIRKANLITTKKSHKILLNISLVLIDLIYIIACLVFPAEPFDFEIYYSFDYMFYDGDFLLNAGIIAMFTPFIWITIVHFARRIFRAIRVRKNAIIKRKEDYICYRGDLDKVSPSLIMFVSTFELDMKKSISATILKLKLNDYIKEKNGKFYYTNKDESCLLESEKMVLSLIRDNTFDKNKYQKVVEQEAIENKYLVKHHGGIPGRLAKIAIAIFIPILIETCSTKLDNYVMDNYHVWPEDDGHAYIQLGNYKDIIKLEKEVTDENDYYSYPFYERGELTTSYNHSEIRADKLQYSVVRKAFFFNILVATSIGFVAVFVLISGYAVIEQLIYLKKNYRRTIKGKSLLNKAYALKNYLNKYSLIHERKEKELVLWEYYLVYAVALGVNVDLQDKLIEKYVKQIV